MDPPPSSPRRERQAGKHGASPGVRQAETVAGVERAAADLSATMRRSYDWLALSSEDEEQDEAGRPPTTEAPALSSVPRQWFTASRRTEHRLGAVSTHSRSGGHLSQPLAKAPAAHALAEKPLAARAKKRWHRSDTRLLGYYQEMRARTRAAGVLPVLQLHLERKQDKYSDRVSLAERRAGRRPVESLSPLRLQAGPIPLRQHTYVNLGRRTRQMHFARTAL